MCSVVSPAMRALNSKHTSSLNASCETEPLTYKRQKKMLRLYCRRSVAKPRRWHRSLPDAHGWRTEQRHCPINPLTPCSPCLLCLIVESSKWVVCLVAQIGHATDKNSSSSTHTYAQTDTQRTHTRDSAHTNVHNPDATTLVRMAAAHCQQNTLVHTPVSRWRSPPQSRCL